MPNHVTNIVRANTMVIHSILTEQGVDFERVIPMPDNVIRGGIGHANIDGVMTKVYWPHPNPPDSDDPMGLKTQPVPYPDGATDWYEWSISNWGTKWNAYESDVSEDERVVRFDTAWSHPFPVIEALSKKYPTHVLEVMYADEDLGANCGAYRILKGEVYELPVPDDYGEAARNFASMVKYGVPYSALDDDDFDWEQKIPAGKVLDSIVAGELA